MEEYEIELQYAIDAGINYFAYCWYGDTPETEFLTGTKKLADWIKKNPDTTPTGHIMTFAWNEFEEGGHLPHLR